jgi:hypothetical protein
MKLVRKITVNLLLLTLVIAFGCSKDDPKPSLIGTWKEGRSIAGCLGRLSGKSTCTGSCNAVIGATTFTDTDQTVYTYTVNGSVLTLKTGATTFNFSYELTVGSLTLASTDQSGCVFTIYYTKI